MLEASDDDHGEHKEEHSDDHGHGHSEDEVKVPGLEPEYKFNVKTFKIIMMILIHRIRVPLTP